MIENRFLLFQIRKIDMKSYAGLYFLNQDISIVVLKGNVEYTRAARPVCIDLGVWNFELKELTEGSIGKLVEWGTTL